MAVSSTLRRAVRGIAKNLMKYAQAQGWGPDDYLIYYRTNPNWDQVHFLFAARAFEGRDKFESYVAVRKYLEEELGDDTDLLGTLSLVIRDFAQLAKGGIYSVGPEYKEFRPIAKS
jgi:hypothetical protein